MASFNDILNPGETILFEQKSHVSCKVGSYVLMLVGLLLIATPIGWLLVLIGIGCTFVRSRYALTNRRLLARHGLLSLNIQEVPLEVVHMIELEAGIWARLWGCGTLKINPLHASNGIEANQLAVYFVKRPLEFRRHILQVKEGRIEEAVGAMVMLAQAAAQPRLAATLPVAALPAADEAWYYARQGQTHGPVTAPELRDLVRAGRVLPNDGVWKEGMNGWRPAATVQGLA